MRQIVTDGIILGRTDYGEADRIIVLLTPDQGKIHLVAKGVRRIKSKLAGGIELFSVSQITYIPGKGGSGLGTLVSSRLITHYGHIVGSIDRTMLGYDLIKQLNKCTEDSPEPEYFYLLQRAFAALDDAGINLDLIRAWFSTQLLSLGGHAPNLRTDTTGAKLDPTARFAFDADSMCFTPRAGAPYAADDIKFLRLLCAGHTPQMLAQIADAADLTARVLPLVTIMARQHLNLS